VLLPSTCGTPHSVGLGLCGSNPQADAIQCDEEKPCSNCKTFGVPCDLVPEDSHREHGAATVVARRGRGRPRKIWHSSATVSSPSTDTSTPAPPPTTPDTDLASINLVQAEMLLHFITTTSQTLAGEGAIMQDFWKRNAPTIGLTHPFVLHLVFSCAAFHLAHQSPSTPRRSRSAYLHPRPEALHNRVISLLRAAIPPGTRELRRPVSRRRDDMLLHLRRRTGEP
jgi:hypothetical protein